MQAAPFRPAPDRAGIPPQIMPLAPEHAWETARQLTGAAQAERRGEMLCWEGRALLFGVLELHEAGIEPATDAHVGLQRTAESAYRHVLECLRAKGYPRLVRVWTYLPRINDVEQGLERYRQFNIGRQEALLKHGQSLTRSLPAACALGDQALDSPVRIGFLGARADTLSLESPRQVSAYHYPPEYGPRSPTFARATLMQHAKPILFISGTAAIVGHRSLHHGDARLQTRETIENLEAVLETANQAASDAQFAAEHLEYVVYLRHRSDLEAVSAELEHWLNGARRCRYMLADICRRELLVEIEAMGASA